MSSYALEQQIGEKRDSCGVDDLKPFYKLDVLRLQLSEERTWRYVAYKSRYMISNIASKHLLLASDSVLCPILKVMPRCANLRVSANNDAVISRNESNRIITA